MPSFQIFTNVPTSDIPENFEQEMTEVVMNILGKPKKVRSEFQVGPLLGVG